MPGIKKNPIKMTTSFFGRYNFVIFVVLIAGSLIIFVLILTSILAQPFDSGNSNPSNFDQVTINRLGQFEASGTNTNYNNLPSGRINPFFE